MRMNLSHRARAIQPSPTLAVLGLANEMRAKGHEVINFGVGEPDFNTPAYIKEEAKKAIDDNFTHYTKSSGIVELREVISEKLLNDNGLQCSPQDILVSPGAKASLMHILMTICDPRDEVIIPSPYWVSYTSLVELYDAYPILLPAKSQGGFKIHGEQLEETIKSLGNPKALILNSPNNPTGAVYTKKELEEIAEVCLRHDIIIISDEIYEKLLYDNREHVSIATISKEVRENTILINGVSKAFAMTGWRLGYAAGPTDIIKCASRIQSHTTSCVNSIAQKAAVVALSQDNGSVEKMKNEFEKRRNFLVRALNDINNVSCATPGGAFYTMPDISYFIHNTGLENSEALAKYLLKNFHIALVPGSAFGAEGYVRFSYATSMKNIKKGIKLFEKGLNSLR